MLNLHVLTCILSHTRWIFTSSPALTLACLESYMLSHMHSLSCTHSLYSVWLRHLSHCATGRYRRYCVTVTLEISRTFVKQNVLTFCHLWRQYKEVPWFMAITVCKTSHFCCSSSLFWPMYRNIKVLVYSKKVHKAEVYKFTKILEATSHFWIPECWLQASSILRNHRHKIRHHHTKCSCHWTWKLCTPVMGA
jgi:hypothetical protein